MTTQLKAKVFTKVHSAYKKVQYKWVLALQKATARFTKKKWMTLLFVFVVISLICNAWLIADSFNNNTSAVKINSIKQPKSVYTFSKKNQSTDNDTTIRHITTRFKQYMDSLARSPGGKSLRDSIIKTRASLIDSIRYLQQPLK